LAQLVHKYLNKIDDLQQTVIDDSELLLDQIDLDEMLKDPEGYLNALGEAFLSEHIDEIEKGAKEGKKFAGKVLERSA